MDKNIYEEIFTIKFREGGIKRRCLRNITSTVLPEEKEKPRSAVHEEMVSKVCWSRRAALWGLEDRIRFVRGKETRERMLSITRRKSGTLSTSPWETPFCMSWWEK